MVQFGALLEDVCPTCRGRFLAPATVERVIVDELGVSHGVLRELTALFASKERLTCPACASKMSAVHVRNVRVDLCTGCGGAWLDAGELKALTSGRHDELFPGAPAATSAPDAPPSPAAQPDRADEGEGVGRASGGVIVFFDDPDNVRREALTAAFIKVPGLAPADAGQIAARKRHTAVENVSEAQAQNVVAALASEGIGAHVADASWLSMPPPFGTNALSSTTEGLTLGRVDASVGRVVVPWRDVAAVVAASVVRATMKRTQVVRRNDTTSARASDDLLDFDVSVVETADVSVEVVLANPPRRFRLLLSTMLFGEVGRPRPVMLSERLAELVRLAPPSLPVGRGVRAAFEGRPMTKVASTRDLERELGWLLWRAYGVHGRPT